jgi:hypothetical protein
VESLISTGIQDLTIGVEDDSHDSRLASESPSRRDGESFSFDARDARSGNVVALGDVDSHRCTALAQEHAIVGSCGELDEVHESIDSHLPDRAIVIRDRGRCVVWVDKSWSSAARRGDGIKCIADDRFRLCVELTGQPPVAVG